MADIIEEVVRCVQRTFDYTEYKTVMYK